jgi:hypothetical protein
MMNAADSQNFGAKSKEPFIRQWAAHWNNGNRAWVRIASGVRGFD